MRTTAKLNAKIWDIYDAYNISIFFAEERHCTQRLCLVNRHHGDMKIARTKNLLIDKFLDIAQLLLAHRLEIREVKAQPFRCDKRSRLLNVSTYNASKCCLQEMGCCVISCRRELFLCIKANLHGVTTLYLSFFNICDMIDGSIGQSLCITDREISKITAQDSFIPYLTASFRMKRCRAQDNSGTLSIMERIDEFSFTPNCNNCRVRRFGILRQASSIYTGQIRNRNSLIFCPRTSCARTLFLHLLIEAFVIQGNSVLMKNLLGKLPRESVGIIEFESDSSRKNSFPRFLQPGNLIVQKLDALCKCGGKAIFLHAYDTLDVILFCQNLTEVLRIAEDRNNGINCTVEEGLCDSEHTSMTDRTAKRATENVPAPLVRRQNSIHNHDGNGTCMVCNDFE